MTRRFAPRWLIPQRKRWRTPQTWRGWLIAVALASAVLVKLTIGLGVVLLLLRHLLH